MDPLKKLQQYKPTLQQLLLADPFDTSNNIDGHMTKELFLEKLFHSDEASKNLREELARRITSDIELTRIIFLSGYSGIGKSTFLHYFINKCPGFEHHYINFHGFDGQELTSRPITRVLRKKVSQFSVDQQINCLRTIKNNISLVDQHFTAEFAKCIRTTDDSSISIDFIDNHLNHIRFNDIFLIFMILLFLSHESKQTKIIYFDNLDAIDIEYLSDIFKEEFASALHKATTISQNRAIFPHKIDFTKRYKFIFCLRDANSSVLNAHIEDSIGHTIRSIPYRLRYSPSFYRSIIDKRIRFINDYFSDNFEIKAISELVLEYIDDNYFEAALVNLFNSDYRKLSYALLQITTKNNCKPIIEHATKRHAYSIRGTLMHCVVRFLNDRGYLKDFMDIPFGYDIVEDGYCHHMRMILNIILNRTDGSLLEHTTDPSRLSGHCTLHEVLKDLKGIYSYSQIFEALEEAILFHKKNWVQLISIYNKPIYKKDAFVEEEKIIQELDSLQEDSSFTVNNEIKKRIRELSDKLDKIYIKINPAGVSYLKYLLTHFEFYSNYVNPNSTSLFEIDPTKIIRSKRKSSYEFNQAIFSVYKRVRDHSNMMRKFYNTRFRDKLKLTTSGYRYSKYSFKFIGDTRRPSGMFHSSRVIYSHIDYIDRYRLQAVTRNDINIEEKQNINRHLVTHITRYVKLLENSFDDSAHEPSRIFQKHIKTIKESNYIDFRTMIAL